MKGTREPLGTGKVVVVTGAARGIGAAIARAARDRGHRVVIGDIDCAAVESAGAELGVLALPLDVTDRASFTSFLDQAENAVGAIDVLVNNAGIMPIGPIAEVDDVEARRCLDINLHGVMLGTKLALARMLPRSRGQIINVASIAGVAAVPGLALYSAGKAGVLAFTEATRLEVRDRGIQVGAVLPTFTKTELISGTQGPRGHRNLEPAEVAAVVLDMIAHPRPRSTAPRNLAVGVRVFGLCPDLVKRALYRWVGLDSLFLDFDRAARADYSARIHD